MELASRGSLLDHLQHKRTDKTNPLRIQEVMKFAEQIALGMEHLINQQVIDYVTVLALTYYVLYSASIVIWLLGMFLSPKILSLRYLILVWPVNCTAGFM